jgi:hypothetical protein
MNKAPLAPAAVVVAIDVSTAAAFASTGDTSNAAKPVKIEVFAPERHDNAGANGFGWSWTWKSSSRAGTSTRQASADSN